MFNDFTKLECPFIRKTYQVDKADWKKYGHALKLRTPEVYLVTPEINPGYEWVLEHPDTFACEKLDGCLHPSVRVMTNRGLIAISSIVLKKMDVEVLSYNFEDGSIEYKPITHYHIYDRKGPLLKINYPRLSGGHSSVVCTEEHKFYKGGSWVKAKHLAPGDLITVLESRDQLSYIQQQLILGTVLGDGHIYKSGVSNFKYSIQFSQGVAQEEYFLFKQKALGSLCRRVKNQVGGYEGSKEVLRANCTMHPAIDSLIKSTFLTRGEKEVGEEVVKSIDVIGIAFWYMDDGSLNIGNDQQPRAFFSAYRYDDVESLILRDKLNSLGFDCSINETSKGNIIGLSKEGSKAFFHTISPFLHKSMMYKVPEIYRGASFWDFYVPTDNPLLKEVLVSSIELQDSKYKGSFGDKVYDLTVEGNNNYFVSGGALVHNSNVGVLMEDGRVKEVQNRKNEVDLLQVIGGRSFIMDGIFAAADMGILHRDGLQYGEILGPKLQSNPYGLPRHLWYPFTKARTELRYNSFEKYPREFWGWSEWFRVGLQSLLTKKKSTKSKHTESIFAEGVIFTNRQLGCDHDHPRMSKLRRDMFYWHYSDKLHIIGLEEFFIEDAKKNSLLLKGYF